VADINDRLSRLIRREEFDRRGAEPGPPPGTPAPVAGVAPVAGPAGSEAGFGEVLDAIAGVVARHARMSVMVAVADGRSSRPVVRVTERDGRVETAVVAAASGIVRSPRPPTEQSPVSGRAAPARPVEARAVRDEAVEPAAFEAARARYGEPSPREHPHRVAVAVEPGGRHAAQLVRPHGPAERAAGPRHASSWQDDIWPGDRRPGSGRHGGLRLVPDPEPEEPTAPEAATPVVEQPTAPGPPATSQVAAHLAELLREDPGLAAGWGREAQES
jgi:hypothetical protein